MGLAVAANGNVTLRAEDGSETVYVRQSTGAFTAPPGAWSTLASTATGHRLVTPDQRVLSFDTTGRLTSVVDARGHGLSLAYTGGRLSSVTDGAGRVVTVTTAADGRLSRATLPDGRFVEYGYTTGRLTSYRDPTGAVTGYSYDAGGRLATATDANTHASVTNTYDAAGRVSMQRDALNRTTTYAWNASTQVATTTDADGVVSFDEYRGNVLVASQNGNGDTQFYRYDGRLNLAPASTPLSANPSSTSSSSRPPPPAAPPTASTTSPKASSPSSCSAKAAPASAPAPPPTPTTLESARRVRSPKRSTTRELKTWLRLRRTDCAPGAMRRPTAA
jgi:YD repeat-containing protein